MEQLRGTKEHHGTTLEIMENHGTDHGESWNNLGQNENHGTT